MRFLDIFKTRRRLILERDMAWNKLDHLRDMIECSDSPHELRKHLTENMEDDPPRILPGSDLGEGQLLIKHWAVSVVAHAMVDLVNAHGGENYLIMDLTDPTGRRVEVTVRKEGGMTPHQKAKKLEKENEELREQLNAYLQAQENGETLQDQ